MSDRPTYEVVVVGGGPAGLTTAIYTTRLGHLTAVFEREGGRHAAVESVHNLFGVSEDVSGRQLAKHAVDQFHEYGGDYYLDAVDAVGRSDDGEGFVVEATHATVEADRVVFATGFTDGEPGTPELQRFTGRGLHYCLHCDAYSLGDSPVFVLGHGESAAHVAMVMLNFTDDVDLLLDGHDPEWSDETDRQLEAHPIDRIDEPVVGAYPEDEEATDPWLGGLSFADSDPQNDSGNRTESDDGAERPSAGSRAQPGGGTDREYRGGFAMYGRSYNTDLAEALGCDLTDDGALAVDEDQETSVDGVYAVGDVTHGHNQTVIALGDGARAGTALHKDLRTYPRPPADLDGEMPVPAAAARLRARMRLLRDREAHAGLREPTPDR